MSFLCSIGLHRYGRHSTHYDKVVERPDFLGTHMARATFTARKCKGCGEIKEYRQTDYHIVFKLFNANMIFTGLSSATWSDDPLRVSEEDKTNFEDHVLDYLWWHDRTKYDAALNFYCAALGRQRPTEDKPYVPKPAPP